MPIMSARQLPLASKVVGAVRSLADDATRAGRGTVSGPALLDAAAVSGMTDRSAGRLMQGIESLTDPAAPGKLWRANHVAMRATTRGLADEGARIAQLFGDDARLVDVAAARAHFPDWTDEAFDAAIEQFDLPSAFVRRGDELVRVVPQESLRGAVDDAAEAATATARLDLADAPTQPVTEVAVAVDQVERGESLLRRNRTPIALGALVGLGATGWAAVRGGSDAPAAAGDPEPTPGPAPAPTPAAEPTTTTTEPTAPDPVSAAARRTAQVAIAESNAGVVAETTASGDYTEPVAKYFSTSEQARPNRNWEWPGYFAAWVRREAGAPIAPADGNWKTIAELIDRSRAEGTYREPGHAPQLGDVVFFRGREGAPDGNNVGIVSAFAAGGEMLVTCGDGRLDASRRGVYTMQLAAGDPRITGFATITD
jgi:hypothetical protein